MEYGLGTLEFGNKEHKQIPPETQIFLRYTRKKPESH